MAQATANRQQQLRETSQVATAAAPTAQASLSIQSLLGSNATLKAEICWTLKVITSHYSLKSCEGISGILSSCFQTVTSPNTLPVEKEKPPIWQLSELHLIFSLC